MSTEVLSNLFERHFGAPVVRVQPLQNQLGGSGRQIVRLIGTKSSAIGIVHNVREENVAFLKFSRHFRTHGLPVPEIYGEDLEHGAYLEEDLGDVTLFQFLSQNRSAEGIAGAAIEAYRQVLAILPRFQVEAGRELDYKFCYPRASFDRQSIAWDLNYFKYYFLRLAEIPFNEQALEQDFSRLSKFLLMTEHDYFLYRDFQSRNIMLRDGRTFFLDYQGGRKGALQYDVASLLYDAKADLPPQVREELLDYYLGQLSGFTRPDRAAFMRHYYAYVYVRIMQALGAYGFRGFYERKPHFLQSVPFALKNVGWLLDNVRLPVELPALMGAFRSMLLSEKLWRLAEQESAENRPAASGQSGHPMIRIFSFSFHRGGVPKDETGNGGGFVFDCRCVLNPGREERFKTLTGKDAAVINFLDGQQSAQKFLSDTTSLVEASVSNYRTRGFENLMVAFGCTGGQHRSVYFAEQLAKHLRQRNSATVIVRHLELEKMNQ
jgi:aminoglycoside/choline kinase family phosphotransferase